jgi:hypothetical protein
MDEVQVDVQQRWRGGGALGDEVRIPDLAEQRARAHCVRSAA